MRATRRGVGTRRGRGLETPKKSPLDVWKEQRERLLANIKAVETTPNMQGDAWKEGQARYFRKLLENHDGNKPKS